MFNRSNRSAIGRWWWRVDKITMFFVFLLIVFGVVCVSSTGFFVAKRIDLRSSFFITKHIWYAFISMNIILFVSLCSFSRIEKFITSLYLISIFLVFSTYFFSLEIKGSKRWLYFFGSSIQPSEFMRIFFVLINAKILSLLSEGDFLSKKESLKVYALSFSLCVFSLFSVIIQPDIGMACLIFCTWMCQIFISGISVFLLSLPIVLFIVSFGLSYIFFDHVHYRIDNFLSAVNSSEMYQIRQSFLAIKGGGFFGLGPGQGKIKTSLPDSHTDFIFSVIGEEFGFIFCLFLLFLYIYISIRSIKKIENDCSLFKILIIAGLAMQFLIQAMINIGVNIQLLPAKGMTLPFISYGGSSILSSSLIIGIILSVNKKKYGDLVKF